MRNTIGAGPDAEASLLGLRSGIQETVLDVRRVVEGLRPPALDDLGLVEARPGSYTDASPLPARVGGRHRCPGSRPRSRWRRTASCRRP